MFPYFQIAHVTRTFFYIIYLLSVFVHCYPVWWWLFIIYIIHLRSRFLSFGFMHIKCAVNWSIDLLPKTFEINIFSPLNVCWCYGYFDQLSIICWSLTLTTFDACWVLWMAISLRLCKRRPKGECQQVACLYFKILVQNSWTQCPSKKKKTKEKETLKYIALDLTVQCRSYNAQIFRYKV